jgi:ABC-type Zn2+ transport system substrate-binding protein/surface adhesin
MVITAKWAAENISPDAIIAAHDLGALGYFDNHQLIDLAGLISPEVIPFIRDEAQIANFLDESNANYLIAFPDFYPQLTASAEIVFVSGSQTTLAMGEKNMAVYLWKSP